MTEQLRNLELTRVGILKLINKQEPHRSRDTPAQRRIIAQQSQRNVNHVLEIEEGLGPSHANAGLHNYAADVVQITAQLGDQPVEIRR